MRIILASILVLCCLLLWLITTIGVVKLFPQIFTEGLLAAVTISIALPLFILVSLAVSLFVIGFIKDDL